MWTAGARETPKHEAEDEGDECQESGSPTRLKVTKVLIVIVCCGASPPYPPFVCFINLPLTCMGHDVC